MDKLIKYLTQLHIFFLNNQKKVFYCGISDLEPMGIEKT
jgi:hypothetical protein